MSRNLRDAGRHGGNAVTGSSRRTGSRLPIVGTGPVPCSSKNAGGNPPSDLRGLNLMRDLSSLASPASNEIRS